MIGGLLKGYILDFAPVCCATGQIPTRHHTFQACFLILIQTSFGGASTLYLVGFRSLVGSGGIVLYFL